MSAAAVPSPLASVREVRVGSRNEPKLAAVRDALLAYAPGVRVAGVAVASGVPEQPIGLDEIIRGARNRAVQAGTSDACDLAVGIEDGLIELPNGESAPGTAHVNLGCAAITDGQRVSLGFSSGFAYPPACSRRAADERAPIGALFDHLWQGRRGESSALPSARGIGNVGRLTLGVLPRAEYARHAVLCALVAFLHPDLYGPDPASEAL
jgi:inosine/xanthosine triphosphatase